MSNNNYLSTDKNSVLYAKKQSLSASNHLFTMLAACIGVVVGVFGSMGYVTSSIHGQMAADTAALSRQMGSYKAFKSAAVFTSSATDPTDTSGQCLTSSAAGGGSGGGAGGGTSNPASPASSSNLPVGGSGGGGGGGTTNTFVHKLVSGIFAPQNATISNTGPDSTNKVVQKDSVETTVTNTNNLNVTNNNTQTANSGSSETEQNTTGGAATSGAATNTSATEVKATVTN